VPACWLREKNAVETIIFKGCIWDDGWEFGCPGVVYSPSKYRRYSDQGNNSGVIEDIVEDICIRKTCNLDPVDGGLEEESEWRGYGKRFDRRKMAWHVRIEVEFIGDDFEFKSVRTKYGPFKKGEL